MTDQYWMLTFGKPTKRYDLLVSTNRGVKGVDQALSEFKRWEIPAMANRVDPLTLTEEQRDAAVWAGDLFVHMVSNVYDIYPGLDSGVLEQDYYDMFYEASDDDFA